MNGSELRARARRHLGPHFTRKAAWESEFPVFVRGEGSYLIDTEGDTLPRRSGRSVLCQHGSRPHRHRRGGDQADRYARLRIQLGYGASAGDRGGQPHRRARPRRPWYHLLRQFGFRGRGDRGEIRAPVPPQPGRAAAHQDHQPGNGLPRDNSWRAVGHAAAQDQGAVRAASAGSAQRAQHPWLPG